MASDFVLAKSTRGRNFTGAIMYFAQGVPYGFLSIAMPAWLVTQGVSAGEIASFIAIIHLPWAFKLLSGPLMDRYQFLAMGRRRPWVLFAQLGLALSFFGLVPIVEPVSQIGHLMMLGFLINVFAAMQDVAVDAMAIDLTPVDEQGRLNAFMTFGKAIGWSATAAVSGVLLVTFGLGVTAIVSALVMALILLAFALTVERDGERRLPWSKGKAIAEPLPEVSFSALLKDLNTVLWGRASLVLMLIMIFDGLVSGYGRALMPIAAIDLFGYTTPQWSQLVAVMGLIGAGVALGLGRWIDRFGAKRMFFLTSALVAVHAFLLAQTQFLWEDTLYAQTMLSAWVMLGPITMVCMIALAMTICTSVNSATQFAIYMSVANLGGVAGSKIYGLVAERVPYTGSYLLMGALTLALLFILFFHRSPPRQAAGGRNLAPSTPVGVAQGQVGVFWSGAMRCPKCRSDMEIIEIDGVQIDRCRSCHGLWFDRGELAVVSSNKEAVKAIDIGDVAVGKETNTIDRYNCPRCGGQVIRMVDPKQPHIWFEQCGSCKGSFFDAGELTDLATFSLSDLFKRFATPERQ